MTAALAPAPSSPGSRKYKASAKTAAIKCAGGKAKPVFVALQDLRYSKTKAKACVQFVFVAEHTTKKGKQEQQK